MQLGIRIRLSLMMFLQFFIWGAWFVCMSQYLTRIGFSGAEIGDAYSTMAIGAIVSPFFVGMIADRFFSAQRVLGVMHLLGGALLVLASRVTAPGPFFWVLLGHAVAYMPTLALVNAVSFQQMQDPGAQFPAVRVLGTIGWIVAGNLASFADIEATAHPLLVGAGASLALGLFAFSLPDTPPKNRGKAVSMRDVLGLDALALMKQPSFAVLVTASLLISIPLAFYYNFTNVFLSDVGLENPTAKMTLGQWSEIGFMLALPWFLKRLGIKITMLLGMGAWALRYVLFSAGAAGSGVPFLLGGIVLHGICYDFFFVSGQIYVDRTAPKHLAASAQGFITLVTYGVGMMIGSLVSGRIVDAFQGDWKGMWLVPAAAAGVIALLFGLGFRDRRPATA